MPGILKSLFVYTFAALCLFFGYLMLKIALPYLSFQNDIDFLLTKQTVLHVRVWRWAFYTHITSSVLVLVTGAFQFLPDLLSRYTYIHRMLGKIYIGSILLLSAPSGFVMAIFANGGVFAKISFLLVSIGWWWFTYEAYRSVRRLDITRHRNYMYRSFSLTLSAITLRLYVLLLPLVIHLRGAEMYILVAWLSWVPNLLVAEWLIKNTAAYRETNLRNLGGKA